MEKPRLKARLTERSKALKRDVYALYLAWHKPGLPWHLRLLAAAIVGYALSPIDLIPDFIPVLGALDDLVIVPAGLALLIRLMPPGLMDECRREAEGELAKGTPRAGKIAAILIALLWIIVIGLVAKAVLSRLKP